MDAEALRRSRFDLDAVAEPIVLPDGKRIYPPMLFGEPIDEIACRLIDTQDPAASRFLRLIGPPGTGKSMVARALAYRLWKERGLEVTERHGNPFYGLVEMQVGTKFRRVLLPIRLRARRRARRRGAARRLRVRGGDAQRLAGDDRRGQHRP